MELFDQIVLPQSAGHLELLKYLLVLTFLLLLPYMGLLLTSSFLAYFYKSKGEKEKNNNYLKFFKELIDISTYNKSIAFAFGVIPFLSTIFCYIQLLNRSSDDVIVYLIVSFLLFIVALLMLYYYKNIIHTKNLVDVAAKKLDSARLDIDPDISHLKNRVEFPYNKIGLYLFLILLLAVYLLFGVIEYAGNSLRWSEGNSIYDLIFSMNTFLSFIQFVLFAVAITSSLLLFYHYYSGKDEKTGYTKYVNNFSLTSGLISLVMLPFFVGLNVIILPEVAISSGMFGLSLSVIAFLVVAANLYYLMLKESSVKFGRSAFVIILIAFGLLVLKGQLQFGTSSKTQFAQQALVHAEYQKELMEKVGVSIEEISGADIFNGRCSACHNFDQKLVGPAYNSVLPKYEGKTDELVKFILNPVKIDPAYPPMPNQGLKPKEAEAIAEYLVQTYKEKI